ncbi:MAG: MG2 domain-containing protein [Oscillibacter sp.]|nr:MG2 domain-containing protein [Oscillibacter sp.]
MNFKTYFLCFSCLIALLCTSCSQKQNPQTENNPYIYSHTSGTILSNTPIRIWLEGNLKTNFQNGETLPASILQFSPSVKGQLILTDQSMLEFIPEHPFKNGQTYRAKFHIGALIDVPKKNEYFEFPIKITELKASFTPGHLSSENYNDTLTYEATVTTSDYIEPEKVENTITTQWTSSPLSQEWIHNGNTHTVKIKNIAKGKEPAILTLTFDKLIGNYENFDITIPAQEQFSVLDIRLDKDDRQSVRIDFSNDLDPQQDLNGLATIEGISGIRYKISKNTLFLYFTPEEDREHLKITLHQGIKSAEGLSLGENHTQLLPLPSDMPAVKFIGKGIIMPSKGEVLLPFSAVALKAVDIQIIKVFQQNMNFFLQENNLSGDNEFMRTARPVFRKKIDLTENTPHINLNRWHDFTVDLSKLIQLEKGVIYRVEIRFRKSYTTLECANEGNDNADFYRQDWDGDNYYYSSYYTPADYKWEERNDPCSNSYYTSQRFISKNIINTSLGLLAKRTTDNRYFIAVNDIATAAPVSNCKVTLYNYQNQKLDSATTDKDGFAYLTPGAKGFIIQASKDNDRAWLKVADGNSLSLSNFDVSGQDVQSGLKGFIYGERGVWRPGDPVYLSFILEDKQQVLPAGHPVIAQLIDPKGNCIETRQSTTGETPIHTFRFSTPEDAPTGYWKALIQVGGSVFSKTLRIETIKPNRMSIIMAFPHDDIIGKGIADPTIGVKTRWLNGAEAPRRKAITEVRLNAGNNQFKNYPDYTFQDAGSGFEPYTATLFDGTTDTEGNFKIDINRIQTENAPGILNATFTTRLFEEGGDFSISSYATRYSPYTLYTGIRLPDPDDDWYPTREAVKLNGVIVNPLGEKTNTQTTVNIRVYETTWRWWWDAENNSPGSYINRSYNNLVFEKNVKAVNGNFSVNLNIDHYGRYYILATNKASGHTAGRIAYFGSWAENNNGETATVLNLSTDKKSYKTGEKVRIRIPSSQKGIAIVSLENGTAFRDIRRIETTEGSSYFEFEATGSMCPNIYAFVTLIQPQQKRDNDHPIRMYGVLNINIEDPALHLKPVIRMPEELRPDEDFQITVSEENQKEMDYTLAIVDEGLLSITSFRTPQPFPAFYAREALGVKTWDFYDYIFGAYGARLEKAFAIGGDEALQSLQDEKTNRFKPVVLFQGPLHLKKGEKQHLTFRMPEYIGEVRAMLVAATKQGEYGSASASALVKKPLMLSAALPRTFTPGDTLEIPLTVFAMDNSIRNVEVQLTANDKIKILGQSKQETAFREKGEKLLWFKLCINETSGMATLQFSAQSGKEKSTLKETCQIRVPNPPITEIESHLLKANETFEFKATVAGADPQATLEITTIPPLNLAERLNELITYPHGCAEQITSAAFPQLTLDQLITLTPKQKARIEEHVKTVIHRLGLYQTREGGFAYWPGEPYTSEWVSAYVAHFLLTAQQLGYNIPAPLLQNDLKYLKATANNYRIQDEYDATNQGYRLYVLALAGKPDLAAMNRMKELKTTNNTAKWLLASAYALSNHPNIGRNLIRETSPNVTPYRQTGYTFGSTTRDQAIILQAMVNLNMQQEAFRMLEKISSALSSQEWMSTQTTAFALLAACDYVKHFVGKVDGLDFSIQQAGNTQKITLTRTVYQQEIPVKNEKAAVKVGNNSQNQVYARLITSSAPYHVVNKRIMSGLLMDIRYYDAAGNPVDLQQLKQGTDITAEISIKNTGVTGTYQNLALSYLLPSGFEIINDRLTGNTSAFKEADYVDIRDDRYYVYFSLKQEQTKTFKFRLNAAFPGIFTQPAITCEAMYDHSIEAVLPGGKVEIR